MPSAGLRKDACVVAGPGSGKTTVLVERCRSLIVDHGFDPAHLLAITFTEKAAANMKAKLTEQFEHDPPRRRELEQAWVSTIHGFCARLLRENAIAAGIDPRFSVLDAREADALQHECIHSALDDLTAGTPRRDARADRRAAFSWSRWRTTCDPPMTRFAPPDFRSRRFGRCPIPIQFTALRRLWPRNCWHGSSCMGCGSGGPASRKLIRAEFAEMVALRLAEVRRAANWRLCAALEKLPGPPWQNTPEPQRPNSPRSSTSSCRR